MKCGLESRGARNSQNIQDKLYNRKILPVDGWYHAQKQWSGTNPARFNLTHEGDYKQCSSFKSSLFLPPASLFSSVVPVRRYRGRDIIVRHVTIRDDFHLKRIVPRQPIHWIYAATLVFFIELDRTVAVLCMARYQRCRGRKTIFEHDHRSPRWTRPPGSNVFVVIFSDDVRDKSCTDGTRSRAVFGSRNFSSKARKTAVDH